MYTPDYLDTSNPHPWLRNNFSSNGWKEISGRPTSKIDDVSGMNFIGKNHMNELRNVYIYYTIKIFIINKYPSNYYRLMSRKINLLMKAHSKAIAPQRMI